MTKNPQSKDDALEALDFIVSVLKEHEKDLDKLINELATVTEQMGDNGELKEKVEKVEEKIDTLQKEMSGFIGQLSKTTRFSQEVPAVAIAQNKVEVASALATVAQAGPSVVLRCNQWEDFMVLANEAQTVSFNFKEEDKIFQANALKGNQFVTYSGALPKLSSVVKMWLSKQLNVPEQCILEGVLTIG